MGESLFFELTNATGLPEELITKELDRLLASSGVTRHELTLDNLRTILANYIQDVLIENISEKDEGQMATE